MASQTRILNLTRGFRMKFSQAQRAVENCACVWVEYGSSIRDLTIAEAITARNRRAAEIEPLPIAEIPGLKVSGIMALRNEFELSAAADKFAYEATH